MKHSFENFRSGTLEPRMRCLVILIYLQTVTKDAGSFDLPNPLDNFYEEVVRFYKRLRSEGGKNIVLKVLVVSGLNTLS